MRSMEGFGFFPSVHDGVADICLAPFRREVRNGVSVVSFPSAKAVMKAVQQRKLHKSKISSRASQDLKAEQNFMVELPSSGLKVSSVLFFQVDQK